MKPTKYKMQFKNLNNKTILPIVAGNSLCNQTHIIQMRYPIQYIYIYIILTYNDQDSMIDEYIKKCKKTILNEKSNIEKNNMTNI